MHAGDFLSGPRGRAACLAYAGISANTWQPYPEAARSPLGSLADATTRAMYWQDPEDFDLDRVPSHAASAVRRAAEELAGHPATSWWASPVALGTQHWVGFEYAGKLPSPPRLTGLRAGIDRLAVRAHGSATHRDSFGREIDWRTMSGIWWSAPLAADGVRSTRAVGSDARPLGLVCVEDELGWERAVSWPLEPVGAPRLYEITEPADWVRLCRDYPLDVTNAKRGDWWRATGRDGPWLMPDWPAVARDWDAVHLTVRGYLTTAGRALDVVDGRATVLAGWDPDATFWLNDVLRFGEPPTQWRRDQDGDWRRCEADADS